MFRFSVSSFFAVASCQRALLALAFAGAVLPAHAGRPLATDDAAVVERGACQLETWTERTRGGRSHWVNPGCNPLGSTEFSIGTAREREDGAAALTVQRWQIKQLLRESDDSQAGFAVAVGGQRVRRGDAREVFLNGIATLPLAGQAQLVHLNMGLLRARDADARRTRGTWGLAYDFELTGASRGALEAFGTSGERANWQLGVRHALVPGHVQIDASVGSALGRWSSTRAFTIGLVFVSPAFLR